MTTNSFRLLFTLVSVTLLFTLSSGRPDYQAKIPNGHKVLHPCFPNTVWKGVGHKFHGGGGPLNPFGEDLKDNEFKWDTCLCQHDSDGDGRTNGEELGDPNCLWSQGDLPEITDGITHPGMCEPVDSEECMLKNDEKVCAPLKFSCEGLDHPETERMNLTFTRTVIPSVETSYYCVHIKFDETRDLHAFAMEPILDNADLVHHIDMYECGNPDVDDTKPPRECGAMGDEGCGGNMLAAWAVGINGLCLQSNVGIRIGKHGAKAASLRIHYHNPSFRAEETDASGLAFYVTPVIRVNDARVLNLGQMYLEIPPGLVEHNEHITFSDVCTKNFKSTVYFALGTMHMHYLGTGGYTELYRDGKKVRDIMVQDFYDYNAPHIQVFDQPIEIQPGDTIRHRCRFHSRGRTDVTWRGQSAMEEMCHVYFVHYPAQNISHAFNEGALEQCSFTDGSRTQHWEKLCDIEDFNKAYDNYMKAELKAVCDTTGAKCNQGCTEKLAWAHNNHSCLSTEARTAIYKTKGDMRKMQASCTVYPPVVNVPATTKLPEGVCVFGDTSTATSVFACYMCIWFSAVVMFVIHQ